MEEKLNSLLINIKMPEIFSYQFLIYAFIAGIAVALTAPLIGIHLVVRRYSLMADTLAHVSLLGVTIGFFAGVNPIAFAVLVSVIASIVIEYLRSKKNLPGDAILAMFISGSLAFTVILYSFIPGSGMNLFSFLFGSITTVSLVDLYLVCFLSIIILIIFFFLHRDLFLVSLDEDLAKVSGIKVARANYVALIVTALSVSLAIKVVGALLVGALMVIPVMTAMNFKKGFYKTKLIAIGVSLVCVIGGLTISYYIGFPSGGTIVIVSLLLFLISFLKDVVTP